MLRYVGIDDNRLVGLTHGRTYYWPTSIENPMYCGVINDEEFTAYLYPTEPEMWEILEDPTGMAYRTIYEKAKGHISKDEYAHLMAQFSDVAIEGEIS